MNNKIGITERGDGGLDFSWVDKIKDLKACIVISKNINDKLIKHLLENKSKIILHATITGYGGSILEPNVPYAEWNFSQLNKLIAQGFPKEQIVLRLDPVIPTPKGLQVAQRVLDINASTIKINRIRTSMIDMYSHVWERFKKAGLYHPYNGNFYPSEKQKHLYCNLLKKYSNINTFEICNENINIGERIGCVSKKDIDILRTDIQIEGCANQRKGCLCPGNKMELLDNKKQCKHGCLYCYWKTIN